jgi:formylglycine-generating enzyme required for sulfatase activity
MPGGDLLGLVAGQNLIVAGLGMEMVYIESGTFEMGSYDGVYCERPRHTVRISRAFWMSKCEVTQAQYEAIAGTNPSHFKGADLPVESVSWDDAVAFCRRLTERERQAGRLPQGFVYRLPTEAEWEYAARGGAKREDAEYVCSDEVAWRFGHRTYPVGQKKPNELELYDMLGNIWEWCHDVYEEGYYRKSPSSDPTGPSAGGLRVQRGVCLGGWSDFDHEVTSRLGRAPLTTDKFSGFRVVASWPLD